MDKTRIISELKMVSSYRSCILEPRPGLLAAMTCRSR